MAVALTINEIAIQLAQLPDWEVNATGELTRTFPQQNFMAGLLFVNRIAGLAEAAGHHPDVLLTYPSVTINLITHDAGGLTVKDFDVAAQIGRLA